MQVFQTDTRSGGNVAIYTDEKGVQMVAFSGREDVSDFHESVGIPFHDPGYIFSLSDAIEGGSLTEEEVEAAPKNGFCSYRTIESFIV